MDLPAPPDARRPVKVSRHRHWTAVLLGVLILGTGLLCGWFIVSQATTGEYGLPALGAAMYLQLVFVTAATLAVVLLRRPTVRRAAIVVVFIGLGLGGTALLVRPQAPTGADHAEDISEGMSTVRADAAVWLDAALPGRWTMKGKFSPNSCRDWLGRDRGSAESEVVVDVSGDLNLAELDLLAEALRLHGWDIEFFANDFNGSTGRNFKATRDGYLVSTETAFDDPLRRDPTTRLSIWTPCLRRE